MNKLCLLILLCTLLLTGCHKKSPREVAVLHFSSAKPGATLQINGRDSFPKFFAEFTDYEPVSFSALTPNEISFDDEKGTVSVDKILPGDFITFYVGDKHYKIQLFPEKMPHYRIRRNRYKEQGYLFLTPFETRCRLGSYAYIIRTNGDFVYFRRNSLNHRCVSDFKKTVLPNGKVRFTLMEQLRQPPPYNYWSGHLLVMDEHFRPLKNVSLLPTEKHPQLGVENHESLMLGEDHFVLTSYYETETVLPNGKPARVVTPVIQEIQDGEVLFDWIATEHPKLYQLCFCHCLFGSEEYQDYLHINSVIIDPKDQHFIVSFGGAAAVVKIHRKTGEILWVLGGIGDQFSLTRMQLFAAQHTASLLPTGELMLLDNHSSGVSRRARYFFALPDFDKKSRILIFELDEANRKVKNFKHIPLPFFVRTMGSVFLTDQGNFFVGYGGNRQRTAQEITPAGKLMFDMSMDPIFANYRVYKYNRLD